MTDGRLRDLDLRAGYDAGDDVLGTFYVPVLQRATRYDRSVGYFRSSALAVAARGLSHFVAGGGRMRMVVGTDLTGDDVEAMAGRVQVPPVLADRLAAQLVPEDDFARHRLEVLAWLVQQRRLFVRIAVPVDADGRPTPGDAYYHEKIGVLRDELGDGVAFQGSVNESAQGWRRNFESFSVFTSWGDPRHFDLWVERFDQRWAGRLAGWRVVELPQALRERLVDFAPPGPPPARDPEEPPDRGAPRTIARYLLAAPTLVGSEALAEATSAVTLFPHQRQVVERLAGAYPRSWLLADEVGLGKTISAGLALRRLVLSGQVRRALILAPASVCRQWQDELFEKFGLWVDRYETGRYLGVHPTLDEQLRPGANPYAGRDLLIASSHLARRRDQADFVVAAGPWDLVVVDEAHHARRQGTEDLARYRPSRLLELLDTISAKGTARAVWLLTATPMQVHPVELRDLLVHVGLTGELARWEAFDRWHRALAAPDEEVPWAWLASALRSSPGPPAGPAEEAVLADIEGRLGPVTRARIERFDDPGEDPADLARRLGPTGRAALRRWLRTVGPVGRHLVRHSRRTLLRYRDEGLLREPVADRHVTPVLIDLTADEIRLYKELDVLIDRLMESSGTNTGIGFVLTVYRRRLTSSWAAIRATLARRLVNEAPETDDDLLEEAEQVTGQDVLPIVPLTVTTADELRRFIAEIDRVTDSKFERLLADLDDARSRGRRTIVFTQFTDTLDALRDRLVGRYRSELATFTGAGGRVWDEAEGWQPMTRQELVEAVRTGRVTVLLATDAASEGLNLQACDHLVNYDMPWNPMRAEQRIGRIDRIGQESPSVEVRNYFIPGTVEERVYERLARRIDDFSDLVGNLQPILGATEDALRAVFRAPRSERQRVEQAALDELDRRIDDLRHSGVDLGDEDPMPICDGVDAPVDLAELQELLTHLGVRLSLPDRPATGDPDRVSRDERTWLALATYGHPRLVPELERVAGGAATETPITTDGALVVAVDDHGDAPVSAAVRADRTPPERVRGVGDLGGLGDPVSTGEAEVLARRLAQDEALARLEHWRQVVAVRTVQREQDLEQRFVRLVRRVVAAECDRRRDADGRAPRPAAVWLELTRDTLSGWSYAETFRQALGLDLAGLVPDRLADPAAVVGSTRRTSLHDTGRELLGLMAEWKQLQAGLG